ncbi:PTS IIA-like nitrogen regulatory protein PtsN [Orrella daihaiensis]|uniref:PTS IIA-like nitrogen regulatory protein PtsN n=1 Tax=Orrella daihaiensis TaxID=2782176 RepID=A0ABY4AK67_9BURK|nr:PTS IIA-like nitrogen regulatory protein PtsN [Orrella daihaiensis]UOD50657.1 PTS IIA-like nitrogen regulatory protein PtsN [Orrella daihaiensis]
MKLLSQILPPENVLLDVAVTSKKRALEQVALLFENNQGLERANVFDNLFARERLGSTGLGHGVAVPHGRIKSIHRPWAAFVRLEKPIAFDAPDGQPVDILLVIVVPEEATQQHLDILAEVAQRLSDESVVQALRSETDVLRVHELLTARSTSAAA